MQLTRFKRTKKTSTEAVVTISDGKFQFSSVFTKLADLDKYNYVSYLIDDNERMIGFDFTTESISDESFALVKGRGRTIKSPAGELIANRPWVRKVSELANIDDRKCVARRIIGKWIIQLCPAFEFTVARDKIDLIPSDTRGIYRYLNYGDVVYIGQGDVNGRAKDPQRVPWLFDLIQYSVIPTKDQQIEWESYWIEKYKNNHNGLLPLYNNQSGVKSISD